MAAEMLKMPSTQKYVIDKVGILLRKELMGLCSYNNQSVLQIPLEDFTWKFFIDKLSKYAPILYSLMLSCTHTNKPRHNRYAIIGVCCSILLKFRHSKVCLFQKLVSLILYAGRSNKMVRITS